jgi:hypothetical protein
MLRAGFVRNVAVVALVAVSCGPSHGTAPPPASKSNASAARQQCPANQTAPHFVPAPPSNRNLEIVWFKGSPKFIVRDITDILHPTTVSSFDDWGLQFVSASELAYSTGSLIRMPLSGSPKTHVASCVDWFAWSPDGTSAAYVHAAYFGLGDQQSELHFVSAGENRVVGSLPRWGASGCESRMCAERFGGGFSYSPNGTYVSFVLDIAGQVFRIWSSDGTVLKSIEATGVATPKMPVWSGNAFYWRDEKGVEVWRDGVQSLLLPGLAWIHPNASPAGGQILFQSRDSAGTAHVDLLDTSTGKVREIVKSRSGPRFLNSHLIWYVEERPCVSGDSYPCGPESTTIETGKTYIYDLQDNTETESVIAAVFDVWPHGA